MEDERLSRIEQEKQNALTESNNTYNDLLKDNENLYNDQKNYADNYEKTQNDILDKQLAYNEEKIKQQREEAERNKEIEAKKARNDYLSFINPYGVNAESQASQGLLQSGLSETTKLGGWNTYQNRLASANKALQDAFTQYDNDMNEARLNNDTQKAQNALNKLQMNLEYAQNFYNNKSTISQNKLSNNQNLDNNYYNRYQTEYSNIQNEKAALEAIRQWEAEMAEQKRQYDSNLAWQKEQARIQQEQWQKEYALSQYQAQTARQSAARSYSTSSRGSSSNSASLTDGGSEQLYEAIKTPILSTGEYDWYNKTFGTDKLTASQLKSKLEEGVRSNKLNEDDVNRIIKIYGVNSR